MCIGQLAVLYHVIENAPQSIGGPAGEGKRPGRGHTLISYTQHLKVWGQHVGEVDIGEVAVTDLRAFLAWLRSDYKLRRLDGSRLTNPMRSVPAPHFEEAPVEPFTQHEVEALLKTCEFCQEARPVYRQRFTMR